jgi:carboxyl-terminal processing protease
MKNTFIISLLFVLILFSCSKDSTENISPEAKSFLTEVLDIMEAYFIRKDQVDWKDMRDKVFETVSNAKTIDDTYPGIKKALILLNESHSYFIKPNGEYLFGVTKSCVAEKATTPIVPSNIGYVKVSSFTDASNSISAYNYANEIQTQIRNSDNSAIVGWIIDLRGNGGGNMYPMLAGIGPLLGDGTAGSFVTVDNKITKWGYSSGGAFVGSYTLIQITNPYNILKPDPKIAILIDNKVASSGEITAIAFIGKEKSKLFGSPSCGFTTANTTFSLSNKSILVLTTSNVADRNGKTYGSSLIPDEIADNGTIISKAIEWINN